MKKQTNMISQNLTALRQYHKYSQEEVAEKVGVTRQAVAKWESGETVPDILNCDALAELYDVSVDTPSTMIKRKSICPYRREASICLARSKWASAARLFFQKKHETFSISSKEIFLWYWEMKIQRAWESP